MKNLIKKVKEILTVLMTDYFKEFPFRVPIRSVKDTNQQIVRKISMQDHNRK